MQTFSYLLLSWVKRCWPLLLLGLVVFASFAPLFFGYMFSDDEQIGFYYPQSFFYQKSLQEGASTLWNNAYYGGVSVSLDQFVSSYYPLHQILFRIFNFFTAHHLSILIAVVLGCFFAYWFGRANGFARSSSFVLAVSYFTATTFDWLSIGTLAAHAFIVLPAMLLSLLRVHQGKNSFAFAILGGAALGVGFLAGFMQIIFYICAAVFFYALFLDWQRRKEPTLQGVSRLGKFCGRFRVTLVLAAMVLVALLIGGRQILPSIFFIDLTIRSSTYALQRHDLPSISQIFTVIFPPHVRIPFLDTGLTGVYIGTLPLLATILGIIFSRTIFSRFFLCLYLIFLGLAFHAPVISLFNDYIPPYSHMGHQARWLLPGALFLGFLAAQGFEGLISGKIVFKQARSILKVFGWAVLFIFAFVVAANIFFQMLDARPDTQQKIIEWHFGERTKIYSNEHYLNVLGLAIKNGAAAISLLNWRFTLPLFLIPLSYFLIRYFLENKISLKIFQFLSIAMISLSAFISYAGNFYKFVPQGVVVREPQVVQEIKKREQNPSEFRIIGFLIADSLFWKLSSKTSLSPAELAPILKEVLAGNSNVFYGLERIDGFEPYRTLRHNGLLDTVLLPGRPQILDTNSVAFREGTFGKFLNKDVWKNATLEEKIGDFTSRIPLLSMLNVKYIYSLVPLADPRLEEIGLSSNAYVPVPLYLYRNKEVMQRIYFSRDVRFFSGRDSDLLREIEKTKDFRAKTWIECPDCILAGAATPGDSVVIEHYESGRVLVRARTEKGQWLVFSESAMPGWIAEIDGADTPIYNANYIWQSVYVPPGEHRIEFKYYDITILKWKELQEKIKEKISTPLN